MKRPCTRGGVLLSLGLAVGLAACAGGVAPEGQIASITVTPPSARIKVGEILQFTAEAKDATGDLDTVEAFNHPSP